MRRIQRLVRIGPGRRQDVGFNPIALPGERIDYDLRTDSWAQLRGAAFVEKQMGHLRALLQQPINVNESLRSVFPFKYFALTDAGRTAGHLLCQGLAQARHRAAEPDVKQLPELRNFEPTCSACTT